MSLFSAFRCLVHPHYSLETAVELARAALTRQTPTAVAGGPVNVFFQHNTDIPDRPGPRRWYSKPRKPEAITTIGFHTTAVKGGFGVANYQVRPWLKAWDVAGAAGRITTGRPLEEHRDLQPPWRELGTPLKEARLQWARLMALRTRYLKLTYHSISSASGELVINQPAWRATWHGNGMNRYSWGHAIDDVWETDDIPEAKVAHELAVLERAFKYVYDMGARPRWCEMHSQHANKPHDPGLPYIRKVVIPFARANGLALRPERRTGKGRPLPLELGT